MADSLLAEFVDSLDTLRFELRDSIRIVREEITDSISLIRSELVLIADTLRIDWRSDISDSLEGYLDTTGVRQTIHDSIAHLLANQLSCDSIQACVAPQLLEMADSLRAEFVDSLDTLRIDLKDSI